MDKKIFVNDLKAGQEISSPFLLLSQSRGQTSRGSLFLNLELADRGGRVQGKVWDATEEMAARLPEGKVVGIKGYVDSYRGLLQLVVREARVLPDEGLHWGDFLKTATRPKDVMIGELWALVDGLADCDYKALLEKILRDPEAAELFYRMPAAKSFHHAYLGGLLEHTLSVAALALSVAGHYGELVNKDLLLAGAILHDLGKIWEFTPPPKVDYSTPGRLLGHLAMGADFIQKKAAEIPGFPPVKLMLLVHLILSHHGEYELGAVRKPQILEAFILHGLDNMDAKVNAISSFIDEGLPDGGEGWTTYHRLLESHFMRTPKLDPGAPLEEAEPEKPLPRDNPQYCVAREFLPDAAEPPLAMKDPRRLSVPAEFLPDAAEPPLAMKDPRRPSVPAECLPGAAKPLPPESSSKADEGPAEEENPAEPERLF